MALLDIKTRQQYLKDLGYYVGNDTEIDGHWGPNSRKAALSLQKAYFTRKVDQDGNYGPNTDTLLRTIHNFIGIKNFKPTEFKCKCGGKYCTGYPAVINRDLVLNLQKLRDKYGKSITVTSGLRCTVYNQRVGGSKTSDHLKGKAADIYINNKSNSHSGRVEIVKYWDTLSNAKYAYCNNYMKYVGKKPTIYRSSTMGNATHVNVK